MNYPVENSNGSNNSSGNTTAQDKLGWWPTMSIKNMNAHTARSKDAAKRRETADYILDITKK